MKKVACLGMVALLALSVGCGKEEAPVEVASTEVVEVTPVVQETEEKLKIASLTDSDFRPFFEALYGYSEGDFDRLNRNPQVAYEGYFSDLQFYREKISEGLGSYFSKQLKSQLTSEDTKLDFDLPKKVLINDYVVDAHGKIEQLEISSSREIGNHMIYEVKITTNNVAVPNEDFNKVYGWSDKLGYYAQPDASDDIAYDTSNEEVDDSYIYTQAEDIDDQIKIVSSYWIEVSEPDKGSSKKYQLEGLKQAGAFNVDPNLKQKLTNNQYVERVAYYDTVEDNQKKLVLDVMTKLLKSTEEKYFYYEKIYTDSYSLYEKFWEGLELQEKINLSEANYKETFMPTINPYKDNVIQIDFEDKYIGIVPSIYSTLLQPNFIVTIPIQALKNDNTTDYYVYKYLVCTENQKVENVQFMKMDKITAEEYEQYGEEKQPAEAGIENETTEGKANSTESVVVEPVQVQ